MQLVIFIAVKVNLCDVNYYDVNYYTKTIQKMPDTAGSNEAIKFTITIMYGWFK